MTLVSVAYRGNIALEDVAVDFEVEPTCSNDGVGFAVRESGTLYGKIPESERVALVRGEIRMLPATLRRVTKNRVAKGNVLEAARLAGSMAAKRTAWSKACIARSRSPRVKYARPRL